MKPVSHLFIYLFALNLEHNNPSYQKVIAADNELKNLQHPVKKKFPTHPRAYENDRMGWPLV